MTQFILLNCSHIGNGNTSVCLHKDVTHSFQHSVLRMRELTHKQINRFSRHFIVEYVEEVL